MHVIKMVSTMNLSRFISLDLITCNLFSFKTLYNTECFENASRTSVSNTLFRNFDLKQIQIRNTFL